MLIIYNNKFIILYYCHSPIKRDNVFMVPVIILDILQIYPRLLVIELKL